MAISRIKLPCVPNEGLVPLCTVLFGTNRCEIRDRRANRGSEGIKVSFNTNKWI